MFAALLARIGLSAAAPALSTLARPLAYLAVGLSILLAVWLVIGWDERRIERSERIGEERMDLQWRAKMEASNREVAQRQTERAVAAALESARLASERETASLRIAELERANAALPNAARVGLSRARTRLLQRPAARPAAAAR